MEIKTSEQIMEDYCYVEHNHIYKSDLTKWVKVEDVKIAIIDMMKNDLKTVDESKFNKLIKELK